MLRRGWVAFALLCVLSAATRGAAALEHAASHLVRRLLELPERSMLPSQLAAATDSRTLAEALVERVHRQHEVHAPNDGDDLSRSRVIVFFNYGKADLIDEIARKGFLNQHQTQKSVGHFSPRTRRYVEDRLLGLSLPQAADLTDKMNELRPKYGFVDDVMSDDVYRPIERKALLVYGRVGAVMKPAVKRRTTWTTADSLGLFYSNSPFAPPDQHMIGARGTFLGREQYLRDPTLAAKQKFGWGKFIEAQIWGPLRMSDVDHFIVDPERITGAEMEKLRRFGLPILPFHYSRKRGTYRFQEDSPQDQTTSTTTASAIR